MRLRKKANRRRKKPLGARINETLFRLFRLAVYAGVVVGISLSGVWLYREIHTNPYFDIKRIDISGIERVKRDEVMNLSGIGMNENIFTVDIDRAVRRLREHPWIKEVRIARRLPDRIVVEIEEREPISLIRLDGELYVMDRTGVVFKRYSTDDGLDLPIVTGLVPGEMGGREPEVEERLLYLMEFLANRRGFNLEKVSEIHVDGTQGFSIYTLEGGIRLNIGMGDFERKIAHFERLVRFRKGNLSGIEAVDLNDERGVVVRFAMDIV